MLIFSCSINLYLKVTFKKIYFWGIVPKYWLAEELKEVENSAELRGCSSIKNTLMCACTFWCTAIIFRVDSTDTCELRQPRIPWRKGKFVSVFRHRGVSSQQLQPNFQESLITAVFPVNISISWRFIRNSEYFLSTAHLVSHLLCSWLGNYQQCVKTKPKQNQ